MGTRQPQPGDVVFALMFRWLDGSRSWGAVIGGEHLFAPSPTDDDVILFTFWGDARRYAERHYAWLSHAFITVDRLRLQRI